MGFMIRFLLDTYIFISFFLFVCPRSLQLGKPIQMKSSMAFIVNYRCIKKDQYSEFFFTVVPMIARYVRKLRERKVTNRYDTDATRGSLTFFLQDE